MLSCVLCTAMALAAHARTHAHGAQRSALTLAQYDQVTAEVGSPPALDVGLLVGWLSQTNTNTMNFLLWDTDGHQYSDMVRFLEATKGAAPAINVWVTLIPPSETVPSQVPARLRPGCTTCPASESYPYGDAVHGTFCCADAPWTPAAARASPSAASTRARVPGARASARLPPASTNHGEQAGGT